MVGWVHLDVDLLHRIILGECTSETSRQQTLIVRLLSILVLLDAHQMSQEYHAKLNYQIRFRRLRSRGNEQLHCLLLLVRLHHPQLKFRIAIQKRFDEPLPF